MIWMLAFKYLNIHGILVKNKVATNLYNSTNC